MANPQPTDAHGLIAHDIQENILIRDFTKQQVKVIYLVLRLSWGCGSKAWQYNNYKDFEVIGLYKSDVAKTLKYLHNNKVIEWIEKYSLLIFNKNYEEWIIPIKSDKKTFNSLIHESLKNANEVRNILTMLGKNTNLVSKKLTELVKNPNGKTSETILKSGVVTSPKESIKESIIYTADFLEFYKTYPRPDAKKRTFNNWKKCLKKYSVKDLMKACMNYKAKVERERTEKEYIKTSANFLSSKENYFEDYVNCKESQPKSGKQDLTGYEPEEEIL